MVLRWSRLEEGLEMYLDKDSDLQVLHKPDLFD